MARSDRVQIHGKGQVEGPQHSDKLDKFLRDSNTVTSGEPFFFYLLFGRASGFHFFFFRDSIREYRKDFFQLDVYDVPALASRRTRRVIPSRVNVLRQEARATPEKVLTSYTLP
jgi:hypothetical protein